jgi:hypothetical protein
LEFSYFAWSAAVIEGLRGTNKVLEDQLDAVMASTFERDGLRYPVLPEENREALLEMYLKSMEKVHD